MTENYCCSLSNIHSYLFNQVEVKAIPVDPASGEDLKKRRLSRPDDGDLTFGGLPPPSLDVPYEVTITDKKEAFHAICMMKV